jgi:hypothetical protein
MEALERLAQLQSALEMQSALETSPLEGGLPLEFAERSERSERSAPPPPPPPLRSRPSSSASAGLKAVLQQVDDLDQKVRRLSVHGSTLACSLAQLSVAGADGTGGGVAGGGAGGGGAAGSSKGGGGVGGSGKAVSGKPQALTISRLAEESSERSESSELGGVQRSKSEGDADRRPASARRSPHNGWHLATHAVRSPREREPTAPPLRSLASVSEAAMREAREEAAARKAEAIKRHLIHRSQRNFYLERENARMEERYSKMGER